MTLPNLLLAFATFRQKVQPEWFAHIHSHGHATARLARSFSAECVRTASKATLDEIEFGAYMHDIGKYLIPKEILLKPGPLTNEERQIMSLHPLHGVEILREDRKTPGSRADRLFVAHPANSASGTLAENFRTKRAG